MSSYLVLTDTAMDSLKHVLPFFLGFMLIEPKLRRLIGNKHLFASLKASVSRFGIKLTSKIVVRI